MLKAGAKVVIICDTAKFFGQKVAKSYLFCNFAAEMDISHYPDQSLPVGCFAATIGFFDGVHLGHQYLLGQLREEGARRGMKSLAVTFDRHPREVVQAGWQPQLLTTLDEKCVLLGQAGIDALVVLRFDSAMAALTARQFMGGVLRDRLHARLLLTGYDNRFGHHRTETFADYERYGREMGIEVVCAYPLSLRTSAEPPSASTDRHEQDEAVVSSSLVRRLLAGGDVGGASRCLGRHYSVGGRVVHGERKGHTLGFPTANLMPCDPLKLIPANGAYAVVATLADGTRRQGMTNIGMRPTFHGERQTLETNIFDFKQDLYGQPLQIDFVARLREEMACPTPADLARQLSYDREEARQLLTELQRADTGIPVIPSPTRRLSAPTSIIE